ncbi:MAG: LPS export ABC transporter permease LptG [Bdellovibrionaceae bacterium]|nr:LPS export ABC transporter permease LptG [Pseudobdellovibrionaceae bacterium]
MFRIDRYIMSVFWAFFAGGLLVFVTIFMAVDAMSTLVTYPGVSSSALASYYLYYLPEVINKIVPIACVLGAVMTLATMARNNELVALFASGMSLARISAPIVVSVLLISGVNFLITDQVGPRMARMRNFVFYNEIKKQPGLYSLVRTDRIWYRTKNSIFNIKTLNPETKVAQGLTMYHFSDSWDLVQMLTAQKATMLGKSWLLENGSVTIFPPDVGYPLVNDFETKTIVMDEAAEDIAETGQTSEVLSLQELRRFISKNKEAGLDTIRYEVDFHGKIGFAFAGLVMCALGIPFSASGGGRSGGIALNIGIVVVLVFSYWALYSSSLTLGNHGVLPPLLAAWLPNLVGLGLGWQFLKLQNR